MKKEQEELLEKLVERRKAVERGEKSLIKRGNYFIASSRTSELKRIQRYIGELREELVISDETSGLTPQQREYVQGILKRVDWLSLKLKSNIEGIQYFIEHPDSSLNYTTETLESATQLLQDLEHQKEELGQLLSMKGEKLADYECEGEVKAPEERNAYRDLVVSINDPESDIQWATSANQQVQELLYAKASNSNNSENFWLLG